MDTRRQIDSLRVANAATMVTDPGVITMPTTAAAFLRTAMLVAVTTAVTGVVACSHSPTEPSAAPALQSIRYVRTRPVTRPQPQVVVLLSYSIPILGDPYGRSRQSVIPLRQSDATTFVYDYPGNFSDIPANTECVFWIADAEVSAGAVARDIFVNGTRLEDVRSVINAVTGATEESAVFRLTRSGRVF